MSVHTLVGIGWDNESRYLHDRSGDYYTVRYALIDYTSRRHYWSMSWRAVA